MTLTWLDTSEIVGGMVLSGRIAPTAIRPDLFCKPYNDIIKSYINGETNISTLTAMHGGSVMTLIDAPKRISDSEIDWVTLLETTYGYFQAGTDLEKLAKELLAGKAVDLTRLTAIALKAQTGQGNRLVPASKISPRPAAFIKSGWPPIDDHLSGYPESGLIIIGGRPSTGKTWFALTSAYWFLQEHPTKTVAFFSAEMGADELRERLDHMSKNPISDDILNRFYINDEDDLDVDRIINRSATLDNVGLIFIDYADLIVEDFSEPSYSKLYIALSKLAKKLKIPVVLISQLSGGYQGGLPRPHHLRYTRLAEAAAWMIFMLWNPAKDTYEDDDGSSNTLTVHANQAYCIVWKVRGGYKCHPEDNPGAILIPFKGEAWHPRQSKWFCLEKSETSARKLKKPRNG